MKDESDKARKDALAALQQAEDQILQARAALLGANIARAQAVERAGNAGLSRREVAKAIGLSPARVQQLLDEVEKAGSVSTVSRPDGRWENRVGRRGAGATVSKSQAVASGRDLAKLAGVDHYVYDEAGAVVQVDKIASRPRRAHRRSLHRGT